MFATTAKLISLAIRLAISQCHVTDPEGDCAALTACNQEYVVEGSPLQSACREWIAGGADAEEAADLTLCYAIGQHSKQFGELMDGDAIMFCVEALGVADADEYFSSVYADEVHNAYHPSRF